MAATLPWRHYSCNRSSEPISALETATIVSVLITEHVSCLTPHIIVRSRWLIKRMDSTTGPSTASSECPVPIKRRTYLKWCTWLPSMPSPDVVIPNLADASLQVVPPVVPDAARVRSSCLTMLCIKSGMVRRTSQGPPPSSYSNHPGSETQPRAI